MRRVANLAAPDKKTSFICPRCAFVVEESEDITEGEAPRPARKGDVVMCGGCGLALIIVSAEGWLAALTSEQEAILPDYTQRAIAKQRATSRRRVES